MTDLTLDVVDDDAGLADLRGEWADLSAADPDPNVFLTWPWATTWWRHFGAGRDDHELHIVVVRDGASIVGIAPLYRSRVGTGPLASTVLQRINHDSGDYGGMLLARRADEAVALLVDHLGAQLQRDVDVVVLTRLASDARFTTLLGDELVRHAATVETVVDQLGDACLFTDVRDGFDLRKQAKKHKIRQRIRRLDEQHGGVAFLEHTGDTLEEGLDRLVTLHDLRWAELDEPMQGLMAADETNAFLLDAIRALDAEGAVRLLSVEAGGTPVAVELDFVHGDRVFLFKGAFDPEFAAFSPGQLLHHKVFEDGLADDVVVFDFCRGDAQYKRRWATGERHLSTITLSRPGLPGALARQRFRVVRAAPAVSGPAAAPGPHPRPPAPAVQASRRTRSSNVSRRMTTRASPPGRTPPRARDLVVVGTHGVAVGAGHGRRQHVADRDVGRNPGVADQQVARLAVLAHHGHRPGAGRVDRTGQEHLVPAAVQHRPWVVAHPAVDGDVGAHAGDVLDRADRVQRDRGLGRDRPARLGGDAALDAGGPARVDDYAPPLGQGGRLLAVDIRDAEPAADRQLGQVELAHPRGDDVDGLAEEVGDEDLAADVQVDADQVDRRGRRRPLDRLGQVARRHPEAELRVDLPGLHELVGVGLDPGGGPQQHLGTRPSAACSRSRRSSSSALSTTMRPTPTSRACASSASLLLLPCSTRRSAGTPAASATCISPPVATSRCIPSSWTRRAIARHRNALLA